MARQTRQPVRLAKPAETYGRLSAGPLHSLAFLMPLVLLYEVGLAVYLSSPDGTLRETILAQRTLARMFELFGSGSLYLPGILLVVMLLVWQVTTKAPWKVRPAVVGGMACESVLWMVPVLVLGLITSMKLSGHAAMAVEGGWGGAPHGWQANVVLSVGAGLYEEMLFRLLLIAVLHMVMHDLLKLGETASSTLAVVGSAVAFTLYHGVTWGSPASHLFFYTAAGAYFGVVFLMRGFGIVVGAHAAYDIMALVVIPWLSPAR